jgi:hypothetical protein
MTAEALRKLAAELRDEHQRRIATRREKCAQMFQAAAGLGLLARKLAGARHGD